MQLIGCELQIREPIKRSSIVEHLRKSTTAVLVLDTCQRVEVYGASVPSLEQTYLPHQWEHTQAFERLARIATGLESRILGELEILGQIRSAYKGFHANHGAVSTLLDRVFQEAISLARKARKISGIDKNLTSLSGLAARELIDRTPNGKPFAVIGSGSIASSVTRYLGKRGKSPVRVISRCPDRAMGLALEVDGFGAGLDELSYLLEDISGIITATAAPHPVLYDHHLEKANDALTVIDLGVPPDCSIEITERSKTTYISLEHIEAKAHINTDYRKKCAQVADQVIRDGAIAWSQKN
ncbi:MAG: hypothetical protein GKR87_04620 [Kiritimatiellae bacterium]|nr:hypothetical protein [Kiritimatiellia bacterium]